jgi:hypothetical protein
MKTMMRYWIGYTRKQCGEKRKDIAKDGTIGSKTRIKMEGLVIMGRGPMGRARYPVGLAHGLQARGPVPYPTGPTTRPGRFLVAPEIYRDKAESEELTMTNQHSNALTVSCRRTPNVVENRQPHMAPGTTLQAESSLTC